MTISDIPFGAQFLFNRLKITFSKIMMQLTYLEEDNLTNTFTRLMNDSERHCLENKFA